MSQMFQRMTDIATLMIALAALVASTVALVRHSSVRSGIALQDRPIGEWESIRSQGHSSGPRDAPVTILEFGDYECPACRGWQPTIEAVLEDFGEQVTLIYRHWPLSYHLRAYPAARAAECAADQGAFWEYHGRLFKAEDLSRPTLVEVATAAGVRDLPLFEACIDSDDPVPTIERDIQAAEAIEAQGTPTVIVNGLLLGRVPSQEELEAHISEATR